MADASARKERSLRVLAWATFPVTLLGVWVQVTGIGIDLLAVAILAILLLGIERTLGDWLGELLGSVLAGVVFAVFIAGLVLYFFADAGGKSQAQSFFESAHQRGYTPVYFYTDPVEPADPELRRASTSTVPAASGTSGSGATRNARAAESSPQAAVAAQAEVASNRSRSSNALGSRLRWFAPAERRRPAETAIALSILPETVARGQRVTMRAVVTSGGVGVSTGDVEFSVGGMGAGGVPLNAAGTATATYSTYIAGTYEVLARYPGTEGFAASLSSVRTLIVRSAR